MTDASRSVRRRAVLMLFVATLYWGLSFPVIKSVNSLDRDLMPGAGSWFIAAMALAPRFVLATALVLLLDRGSGAPTRSEATQGAALGAFAAAGAFLQTDGLQYASASTSSFLTQFSAILIPAWVALRSRRSPGAAIWVGCLLVLVGVAVLGHLDVRTLRLGRGEWETLLCSLFYTGQILWVERPGFEANRPAPVTFVMFLVQSAAFCGLAAATSRGVHAAAAPLTSPAWLALTLILAVVCTLGPFSIMNKWQPRISATHAGLVYCIEPLSASLFALFVPSIISAWAAIHYPNEQATWSLVIGGGLITAANVLVLIKSEKSSL
jgi:drug/metabolite transporter (DMT)-like permease